MRGRRRRMGARRNFRRRGTLKRTIRNVLYKAVETKQQATEGSVTRHPLLAWNESTVAQIDRGSPGNYRVGNEIIALGTRVYLTLNNLFESEILLRYICFWTPATTNIDSDRIFMKPDTTTWVTAADVNGKPAALNYRLNPNNTQFVYQKIFKLEANTEERRTQYRKFSIKLRNKKLEFRAAEKGLSNQNWVLHHILIGYCPRVLYADQADAEYTVDYDCRFYYKDP